MAKRGYMKKNHKTKRQTGFSLLETMIAMAVLLGVGSIVMYGTLRMMNIQGTITNRTEMHTSVRSATELLQQEIGQAGRIAPPLNVAGTAPETMTLLTVVPAPTLTPTVTLPVVISPDTAVASLFNGEWITVDGGMDATGAPKQESVAITCGNPCSNPVTATFTLGHALNVPVSVQGAFANGVVPPNLTCGVAATPCGSDQTHLKLFGDINGDGRMVYLEYTCQQGTQAAPGFLYRNQMAWNQLVKPAADSSMILLNNVLANPADQNGNAFPCFQYQIKHVGACPGVFPSCTDFVTNVEVTLTEQTELLDPTTKLFQTETKALLNVSPRNVFNAWELDSGNLTNRVQPTPPSVTLLLP